MSVDSFKYLPRLIAAFYQSLEREPELPIPWTPVPRSLDECKFGLVTSGGLFHREEEAPFDLERERYEPTWGDPTFRTIPAEIPQTELGASHLHINTADVLEDINILLPIHRFRELVEQGVIGGIARNAYSFMGYQGFPPNTLAWEERFGIEVAKRLQGEGVDCVLLTPA